MIPPRWRRIARERVSILVRLAREEARAHPERSKRYIELAMKIAEKYKVRLPKSAKRKFCKRCRAYWIPGVSVSVRLKSRERIIAYICASCGYEKRYPYAKKARKAPN
ncbi:MAG: ribonuclease P [Candidatus Aenigmatarchaeota archaeon]|nr:MAG: ribonuclease P [Candidatus Aenigmarchaeota archaeon]